MRIITDHNGVPEGDRAGRYVSSLMRDGTLRYFQNIDLPVCAAEVDGSVVPLVLNCGKVRSADVCSPYAHYLRYTIEEFSKRHPAAPRFGLNVGASAVGALLRSAHLDRVALLNNWLLATNPSPEWSGEQIGALTRRITQQYPDFAVVIRSVNPVLDGGFCSALVENGYRLVRGRRVYILDARSPDCLEHQNLQRDIKLLESSGYRVIDDPTVLELHTARMQELYRRLYVSKHSGLNCDFTSQFFALMLKHRIFCYRALERDGRIDGFLTYFVQRGLITGAVAGYDCDLPQSAGLYRMLMAVMILKAARQQAVLNLSAGAGSFKQLRGAVPVEEFDAVYDSHLPTYRRAAWTAIIIGGRFAARIKR